MEGHCHLFSDLKWPISDILHLFLNTFKAELLVVKKKQKWFRVITVHIAYFAEMLICKTQKQHLEHAVTIKVALSDF